MASRRVSRTVLPGRRSAATLRPRTVRSGGRTEYGEIWRPIVDYRAERRWQQYLVRLAVLVDLISITLPTATVFLLDAFNTQGRPRTIALGVSLPLIWLVALRLGRAHEPRFLGLGSEEFKRVFDASLRVFAFVAIISFAFSANISRGLIAVGLPSATALNLLGRYAIRKWVHRERRQGRFGHRVLLVGNVFAVGELARTLNRAHYAGMTVVGCCLDEPSDVLPGLTDDVPVLGSIREVPSVVAREGITALAVTQNSGLDAPALRRLVWGLEGTGVDILMAPSVFDIVGPRIHIRPVAGLPLLHIEEPQLSGAHRLLKSAFDRGAALAALFALAIPLLVIGLLVRLTSPGPALFRQVRIGANGRRFTLYKFRTMSVDAEARLPELLVHNDHGEGPLFKMVNDPRITRIGGWLRRYSLDELPQLINVLLGHMSLVGPRPPLPVEVAQYANDVRRRLMVPPGLTGLWQVSGRSNLDWEESVRLDLYYVENWSLTLDFMILWKTLPAVLRRTGAY